MTRDLAVRLTLSAVGIVCTVLVLFAAFGLWPATLLPVRIEQNATGQFVVMPVTGSALPPALIEGDRLNLSAMTPASRAALLPEEGYIRRGAQIQFAVIRDGRVLRVPLAFAPQARSRAERLQYFCPPSIGA